MGSNCSRCCQGEDESKIEQKFSKKEKSHASRAKAAATLKEIEEDEDKMDRVVKI